MQHVALSIVRLACASRASRSMDVLLSTIWRAQLDNERHVRVVNASRSNVRGYKYTSRRIPELAWDGVGLE